MSLTARFMLLLFLPASLGLLAQIMGKAGLAQQLLALALLLLCVEQARMAVVDLEQIALVKDQIYDSRLSNFHRITTSTIILELLGFYSSSISLGWGAVLVLLSQVWFNLLAGIQLQPLEKVAIRPSAISERLPVLIANGIGLILVSLWLLQVAPLSMASGLLGLVIFYIWVKYAPAVLKVK